MNETRQMEHQSALNQIQPPEPVASILHPFGLFSANEFGVFWGQILRGSIAALS
jgi:hypothetical protein